MMTIRRGFIAVILVAASAITLAAQTRATEPAKPALAGTEWTLTEIVGEPPLEGHSGLDLQFGEEGAFGTSAGCNRFRGTAEIKGEAISFPDRLAGTMMACPEGLAEQEEKVLALLAQVTAYRVEATELVFLDADGAELLRYAREAEAPETLIDTKG